jgi:hypothetical protein
MDKQKLMIETIKESQVLERKRIELNQKFQKTPFFVPKPRSATDMELVCEIMNPNNLLPKKESNEETDFFGAVLYGITDHDFLLKNKENQLHQLGLFTNKIMEQGYRYVKQSKFKFISPLTELYRNRSYQAIKRYLSLQKVPNYLSSYFTELLNADKDKLDIVHNNFWHKMFTENLTAHFIKWHLTQQQEREADIFIPPVPFVNYKARDFLLDKAIEVNSDSVELVGETSATYFPIDVQMFRYRESIQKILEYLDFIDTKFNLFKINNADAIIGQGFGQDARKNFEWFLKVIKSMKESNPSRVFGILNGGGFGYCLIGAGFDFFVDNVDNYSDNPIRPSKKRSKFRKILNPETLSLEPFEGAMNILKDNGVFIGDNSVIKKYAGKNQDLIDSTDWSKDCKRHGMLTWNDLTKVAVRGINEGEDSLYFDKIVNSDYAILGNIIRNL